MSTKTTPVHPLLVGTTPGEYIIDGSSIFVLNEDGTNRISAQVQRGWENQWKDGGSRTTNEEVEAVARLFRAAPSLAAENALLAEENAKMRDALRKCVSGFDDLVNDSHGIYGLHLNGDPSPWGELTEGGRFEEWTQWHTEARDLLTSLTPASKP